METLALKQMIHYIEKRQKDELTAYELAKNEQEKKKIELLTAEQKQAIIDGFSVYSVFTLRTS